MGQSAEITRRASLGRTSRRADRTSDPGRTILQPSSPADQAQFASIFATELGWFGLLGSGNRVAYLTIGHPSAAEVQRSLNRANTDRATNRANAPLSSDWNPELKRKLERYAQGECVDFSDCRVEDFARTPFQQRVITLTRSIPYGETISYGELAAAAGFPRAARAVGSVMAQNRVPLIIPCHRVVGSGGRLGGFSAPRGVAFKKRLLELESAGLFAAAAADSSSRDCALGVAAAR